MIDVESLIKRYNVEIGFVIDEMSFSPITKIKFSDGHIINIKTSVHNQQQEYMNSIEKEIKTYNIVLRTKKLERICNG